MSNQLQFKSFDFKNFPVRVIIDNSEEYWFCAKDVCDILGYLNDTKAIKDHCKEKGVTKRYSPTKGGNQELTFINEPNLYRLIIKSRKPEAEPFEAWVFEEVLPQIRKTGKYQLEPKQLALPEPARNFNLSFEDYELEYILWSHFALTKSITLFKALETPLQQMHSALSPSVSSFIYDYGWVANSAKQTLKKATAKINIHNDDELSKLIAFIRQSIEENEQYHSQKLKERILRRL